LTEKKYASTLNNILSAVKTHYSARDFTGCAVAQWCSQLRSAGQWSTAGAPDETREAGRGNEVRGMAAARERVGEMSVEAEEGTVKSSARNIWCCTRPSAPRAASSCGAPGFAFRLSSRGVLDAWRHGLNR
jgi:hypothetical protein